MPRPERYQLAFDFQRSPERSQFVYPELISSLRGIDSREPGVGRFVRPVQESVIVASPVDAARYLLDHVYTPFESFDQEELWVLLLNSRNRITHDHMVYRGSINSIQVRQAEIFKEAVRTNAALILSHCHPSGDTTPSPADIQVTSLSVQAAQILNIDLLDHIIWGMKAGSPCAHKVWASRRVHEAPYNAEKPPQKTYPVGVKWFFFATLCAT